MMQRLRKNLNDVVSGISDNWLDPYIIAEIGVNYEGSMDRAKEMISSASRAGADAVKFQTYRAKTIAAAESPSYWDLSKEPTTNQRQLFERHEGFWQEEMEELAAYCESQNIDFLSTPFDYDSAKFLAPLMKAIKISSSDLTNKPFIEYLASFELPIIMSTGASSLSEIVRSVEWIGSRSSLKPALLHCVLNYPTQDQNACLGMIKGLVKVFPNLTIGYSDHTLPKQMGTCLTSVLLGARIIEKHYTFDKTLPGNDHYHAMDADDLASFKEQLQAMRSLVGSDEIVSLDAETVARQNARRSLVLVRDVKEGEVITNDMLTQKRPASGICPSLIDEVLGKKVRMMLREDTILRWHHVDDIA